MSDAHPGITEIYIDLPIGLTDATTGEARKVVGYMCNACRRAFLNGAYVGDQAAKGPASRCCWCGSHEVARTQDKRCPGCEVEREARENEARWKREAALLAQAIPATPDMEGFFDDECEHFYSDAESYFDYCFNRAYPDSVPSDWIPIVYEAVPAGPATFFDAEELIERANDNAEVDDEHLDCMLRPTPDGVAELQAALDDWIGKHGPKGDWLKPGRPVRLDAEFKHWLAENPDAVAKNDEDEDESAPEASHG